MQSIEIGVQNYTDEMLDFLTTELNHQNTCRIAYSIRKHEGDGLTSIILHVTGNESVDQSEILGNSSPYEAFTLQLSHALTEFIISKYEEKLLHRIINANYFYYNKDEKEEIVNRAERIIKNEEKTYIHNMFQVRRRNFILRKLMDYFDGSNDLMLDGFVNFRLKEYVHDLEEIVDKAVEEFITEKEYMEFIKLLKYFIKVQEPKYDTVHLFFQSNGSYRLEDNSGNDITGECTHEFQEGSLEFDLTNDDILVSTLISLAPKKLFVHQLTNFKNIELMDTILNIFAGKLLLCQRCESCAPEPINEKQKK